MLYAPTYQSATTLQQYPLGQYTLELLGNIQSDGLIEYGYIMTVTAPGQKDHCLFVTTEVNPFAVDPEDGSHFLCVFDDNGHSNLGDSNEWVDREKFSAEATRIIQERLRAPACDTGHLKPRCDWSKALRDNPFSIDQWLKEQD